MEMAGLSGLRWLVLSLVPFVFVQRWFHRELQQLIYSITHSKQSVAVVFSVLFFPGVLLHEGSHFLAAKLLGVRTGRFSLKPSLQSNGSLRMGFVEVEKVDFIRNALIGAAPLFVGAAVISALGLYMFDFDVAERMDDSIRILWQSLQTMLPTAKFWIGLYLVVAISSMMLPSSSDWRSWPALILFFALFGVAAYLAGLWGWFMPTVSRWTDRFLFDTGVVFSFSLLVHLVFMIPVLLLRVGVNRLSGQRQQKTAKP